MAYNGWIDLLLVDLAISVTDKRKLTPRQKRFVEEYLIDLNASRAARRAGYSPRSADRQAFQQLEKPQVVAAIAAALERRSKKTEITAERVLRELATIAFSDARALYDEHGNLRPIHELDDDAAAALAGIDAEETRGGLAVLRKVKRWDKAKALELLGRHLGMWNDKLGLHNTGDGPLKIELVQFGNDSDPV